MIAQDHGLSIRQRVPILVLVVCALFLLSSTGIAAKPGTEPSTDPAFNDWINWDWKLDRIDLARIFIHKLWRPDDPRGEYATAVAFAAPMDSIGLTDFAACTAEEREQRRQLAAKYYTKAMRFRSIVLDHWHYNQDGWSLATSPSPQGPPGTRGGMSRCLHNLITAVGLCPADPHAWYDLAYLASVIGDRERQDQALMASWGAIAYVCRGVGGSSVAGDAAAARVDHSVDHRYDQLRHRLALDRAWLYRDRGQWSAALAWVDSARAHGAADEESRLLRGLALAGQGHFVEAIQQARAVSSITTYLRSGGGGYAKNAWHQSPSDYAARWIQAMAWIQRAA